MTPNKSIYYPLLGAVVCSGFTGCGSETGKSQQPKPDKPEPNQKISIFGGWKNLSISTSVT